MPTRPLHLVACWLTAFATLLNATATAAELVLCQSPQGEVTFEAGCAHDHCEDAGLLVHSSSHEHDGSLECSCFECGCKDTPISKEIAAGARRGLEHSTVPAPTLHLAGWLETPFLQNGDMRGPYAANVLSPPDQTARALRTVVLLI